MNRLLVFRILLVAGLLAIIGGAIYVAGNATKDAPNHAEAGDSHEH